MEYLIDIGARSKSASRELLLTTDSARNDALIKIADSIVNATDFILGETTAKVDFGLIAKEHRDTNKWIPVDLP